MTIKVAVLSGLTYPVPPIRGGGPQIVLYNTCLNINDPEIDWKILANWDPDLEEIDYDRDRILAIKTTALDRLTLALVNLLPYRIRKRIFSEVGNRERLLLNLKIIRKLLFKRYDVVICHESFSLAYLVHLVFPRKKIITYIHNSKVHLDFDEEMWKRYVIASTGGMVLGSKESLSDLQQRFGYLPRETRVILNGIDIDRFNSEKRERYQDEMRERYGIPLDDFVFIYCGRISPIKNIDRILKSFLELADDLSAARLVIVGSASQDNYGDISYEEQLHRMIPEDRASRVIFTGFIPQEELPQIYAVADCGILGTKKSETLTLFLLECLACGIPVIAPKLGALPDVIREEKEGILLARDYSIEQMQGAMRKMIRNKNEWQKRSKEIEQYIHQNFTWQRVAGDVVKFIREVV